ncbi:surface carbohydrate biosynthesis protein [Natrialbaceae archaeon A-arb3/5]
MKISIPLETVVREFDAGIYLSLKLVESGHEVYIGRSTAINHSFDMIDPDIYISKCGPVERELADKIRGKILLLDPEGGIFRTGKEYSNRINPERLDGVDYYLAWGESTANIVEKNSTNTNVVVTGNPRFDLLQPPLRSIYQDRSAKIVDEYGEYILINTKFSISNHESGTSPPENELDRDESTYEYNANLFLEFIDMIQELSKHCKDEIIIRPHPSENFDTYRDIFSGYDHIHTIHEGDVRKWIAGSRLVIHNSCTTGVEAALMNKKVYAYDPVPNSDPTIRSEIPNYISIQREDLDTLIRDVKEDVNQGTEPYFLDSSEKDVLSKYIGNVDYSSSDRIVNLINSISDDSFAKDTTTYSPDLYELAKRVLGSFIGHKSLHMIRNTGLKGSWSVSAQKFPYLSDREVQNKIGQFDDFDNIPNVGFERVKELENTFHIYNNDS